MGGGASSSKFRCVADGGPRRPRPDWLADPCSRVTGKQENFTNVTAIGKGKFGFVYLCRHNTSQKHVAIKYISKSFVHEHKSLVRINQEIALLQIIDHPFLIHCFCGFDTPQLIALVFEYAHGGELFTYMKKNNRMAEGVARFYFCEIALALSYLHETLETIYRDLKPENVLIDYEGHVKLCDFGFAVKHNAADGPLHDGCGTAMYVAPEIAGGFMKCAHSFPVDWWSLGCVLAEMVTGKAPFGDTDSSSKFEVFNNINQSSPNLPLSGISSQLRNLIRGLLDKDPAKRYSWAEVKRDDWVKEVNFGDLLSKAVTPPWLPPLQATEPSTANFVSWKEMKLPSKPIDAAATNYLRALELPKPRASSRTLDTSSSARPIAASSHSSGPKGGSRKASAASLMASAGHSGGEGGGVDKCEETVTESEGKHSADIFSEKGSPKSLLKKNMSIRQSSSRKLLS